MDHQQPTEGAGPVDVPAEPVSTREALRAAFTEPTDEQVSEAPEEGEPVEGDLTASDFEEEVEQEGEQETAIAAPVSLNAEEKAAYAQLPEEAQSFVAALEARRNADVTKVTTKAADAQRAAEAQAAQAAVEAKRNFAEQLDAFIGNFAPQMPDPALAQRNPGEYIALKAQYDAQIGQFDQLKHQVAAIGQEAEAEGQRAFIEARDKALMQIPEIANPDTRQEYLDRAFSEELHTALGYAKGEVVQFADAEDVKRLNIIAGWREKAEKYDAAMSKKMKKVRQGKLRTSKPGPAQQDSSKAAAFNQSVANLKKTGSRQDARAAFKAALT